MFCHRVYPVVPIWQRCSHVFTFRTLAGPAIQNLSGPAIVLGGGIGVGFMAARHGGDNVTLIHRGPG
ncbi:MAG: hypothetical protein ACLR9W_03835 [Enterobacter hormaechei]